MRAFFIPDRKPNDSPQHPLLLRRIGLADIAGLPARICIRDAEVAYHLKRMAELDKIINDTPATTHNVAVLGAAQRH